MPVLVKKVKSSNIRQFLPLVLLFFILFGLFIASGYISKLTNAKLLKPRVEGAKVEVPELKDILSSDQTTRLKGARALAQRVGPDEAMEIVKNSGLPYTGEGHLAVHQIGFVAYEKYGVDAILHCKDYFLSACYHGAIIEASTDQGFDIIKKMADRCRSFAPRFFQCVHASGHAINAIWNYDLPKALGTCDGIFEQDTQFPDTLASCHNGAFMENLFGVHDWGTAETPKRDWLKDDDYFYPCDAFGEKYQKGCWLNQGARIYQMEKGDLPATAKICDTVENNTYRDWCFDNLARQIHPLTESDIGKVWSLCSLLGQNRLEGCVMINAMSYYSVGDRPLGIDVCNTMSPFTRSLCLEPIINYVAIDNLTKEQKMELCARTVGNDANNCFSKIN